MRNRPREPAPFLTRNDLISMYRHYPGALAEQMRAVLLPISGDAVRFLHDNAVATIQRLVPDDPTIFRALAETILELAQRQENEDQR